MYFLDTGKDATYSSSEYETHWRNNTIDYKMRFCGHCNTTTDIKEANFFGKYVQNGKTIHFFIPNGNFNICIDFSDGQYIVAGSDDGSFFIWERDTTNIVRVLRGDDRIVNCLQPHPSTCLLATSGIESVIRLWSPLPEVIIVSLLQFIQITIFHLKKSIHIKCLLFSRTEQ